MKEREYIRKRVHELYWRYNKNCAITTLTILSEMFDVEINDQVYSAAIGMYGAGGHGGQCGLVEGTLLLLGILGKLKNFDEESIVNTCFQYADAFKNEFGSLLCSQLRPEGFKETNPSHLCEKLSVDSIYFSYNFIKDI